MRLSSFGVRFFFALILSSSLASIAAAQITPGDPGWFIRVIDSAGTIDSLAKHDNVLAQGAVLQVDDSTAEFIDFNGGPWTFNNPWPVELGTDFVVRGLADVTIPAGHWGVGWGSDDGGQMRIPGVEFVTSFENDRVWDPVDAPIIGTDRLTYDGNRGYQPSFGSFFLEEPLETTIDVSMWERGGGDNFEVFYVDLDATYGIDAADLTAGPLDRPSPDNLWDLLGDPDATNGDWNIRIPQNIPSVAIPVTPGQQINGTAQNVVKEAVGDILPGLLHHWYGRVNPGSLEGVSAFYDINAGPLEEPDIEPFNPDNTWWTGNQAALVGGTTEAPKYPAAIIDQTRLDGTTFNGTDNSNYTTALSGELRFPRDGEYIFADGVDDLTIWAVDLNRDGTFGEDEILINDNAWTSLNRDSNDGGFPNDYIPVTIDVPEDGNCDDAENASDLCWYRVEAVFGEGGGTDAGIIYWNENADVEFPTERGDGRIIADEDIPELAIPEDHLRAPGGVNVTSAELVATLNGEYPYQIEINEDGTFDSLEVARSIAVASTELALNGAKIELVANGDLSGLNGELQILSADSLSGELGDIVVPDGVSIDTSRLASEGILVFGTVSPCNPNSMGDLDGNGKVEFADFLTLSGNFGKEVADHTQGDIDCNGKVEFADFLALSGNFGNTVGGAESVPEPTGLALLGLGGMLLGLWRRRR